jgi:hypothetical protein
VRQFEFGIPRLGTGHEQAEQKSGKCVLQGKYKPICERVFGSVYASTSTHRFSGCRSIESGEQHNQPKDKDKKGVCSWSSKHHPSHATTYISCASYKFRASWLQVQEESQSIPMLTICDADFN